MSSPRHYVPEIRRFLVAQHQGVPMTKLANRILEHALAGSIGWQRATQAMNPSDNPSAAEQGR